MIKMPPKNKNNHKKPQNKSQKSQNKANNRPQNKTNNNQHNKLNNKLSNMSKLKKKMKNSIKKKPNNISKVFPLPQKIPTYKKKSSTDPIPTLSNKNEMYKKPGSFFTSSAQNYHQSKNKHKLDNSYHMLLYSDPKHFTQFKKEPGITACVNKCLTYRPNCNTTMTDSKKYPKCHLNCINKCFINKVKLRN